MLSWKVVIIVVDEVVLLSLEVGGMLVVMVMLSLEVAWIIVVVMLA